MANTTDTLVRLSDRTYYQARFSCVSDGTGADQTNVVLIDKSALTGWTGAEPAALDLVKISAQCNGLTRVSLTWDHTADDEIISFGPGGLEWCDMAGLRDPRSAGGTGDVLVSTLGMAANGFYIIEATFELRAQ